MNRYRKSLCMALALASAIGVATADEQLGRQVFERRCLGCHGGTAAPTDYPIGPRLDGIIGSKRRSKEFGVHSRVVTDPEVVWDRTSLRRFLTSPQREIPGTLMAAAVSDPVELENLLDYLESLH